MRILLVTHLFPPSIGGIETTSLLLAREFIARGHEVRIVTSTPATSPEDDHGLVVIRQPSRRTLVREVAWASICFHNNICLNFAWPILFTRKPWVITTQTWIERAEGTRGWREHLKRLLLHRARSVAISPAIARSLPVTSILIPNCYDQTVFREAPTLDPSAKHELVFSGRLVSSKGVDTALKALALLAKKNSHPRFTIIGDGPEKEHLQQLVLNYALESQVTFKGPLLGSDLAQELQRHRIQLVPSLWAEPFGIVALEGAACGCTVIGSALGGLPDAIGPCGITFPNDNPSELARLITTALKSELKTADKRARDQHLHRHHTTSIARDYVTLFQRILTSS